MSIRTAAEAEEGCTDKSQTDKTGDNRVNNKCPLAAATAAAAAATAVVPAVHCVYRAAITPRARARTRPATDGQDNALRWRRINRRRRRLRLRLRPR